MIKAGGKNFKTKASLTAYCKYVLNTTTVGTFLEGEWSDVLSDVLRMHTRFTEKVGNGSFKIGVRVCPINPRNRQFFILREDGSDTDFSYVKAISESKDKLGRLKEALRASTKDQTVAFKNNYFKENQDGKGYVVCPETSLKIKLKDRHIDHYPKQFDEIVKEWSGEYNVSSEDVVMHPPGDNGTTWIIEDESLVESFQQYHLKNAEYRIVLNKVNQQRKKSKRAVF